MAAFENPGYDNRGAFDDGGTPDNNDVGLVMFPSYEENTKTNAATNAVYTEVGMARISPDQSINKEDSNAGSVAKRANLQVENNTQRKEKNEEAPIYVDISNCRGAPSDC